MKNLWMALPALGLFIMGQAVALAIPHVYECRIVDYRDSGAVSTDFTYTLGGGYRSFKSEFSEVRLNYSNQDGLLSTSLRPLNNLDSYARREDRGTPLQMSLTHVASEYSATVRCRL